MCRAMLGSIGLPLMIDKRNLCLAKNGAFKIANCGGDGMELIAGGGDEISSLVEGKATSLATAPGDSAGRTIQLPQPCSRIVRHGEHQVAGSSFRRVPRRSIPLRLGCSRTFPAPLTR